jgi:hypothetical protein
MNLFLLWQPVAPLDPTGLQAIAEKFAAQFAPFFRVPLHARVIHQPPVALVNLWLPVRGWHATDFESDAEGWALALDYPTNAAPVCEYQTNANGGDNSRNSGSDSRSSARHSESNGCPVGKEML